MATFRAGKLIYRNKPLLRMAMLPVLVNIIVLAGLTAAFFALYPRIISGLLINPEKWWQYITYYLSATGITVALLFFAVLLFAIIANLIASPLNESIALRTLKIVGAELPSSAEEGRNTSGFWSYFKRLERLTISEAKKAFLICAVSVFSLLLGLIPILNIISFLISAFLAGFAFFDYSPFGNTEWRKRSI